MDIIYFEAQREDMMVEVAMQYTTSYTESLLSFANNIPQAKAVRTKQALNQVLPCHK